VQAKNWEGVDWSGKEMLYFRGEQDKEKWLALVIAIL